MITKLTILIPLYNEETTILTILNQVTSVTLTNKIDKEIIVIDDKSTDKSKSLVEQFIKKNTNSNIKLFSHLENMGKGACLHTGISKASGEYLIIQDADLEYYPEEYNLLLNPVLKNQADVVYGSRFMGKQPKRILYFWHYQGNKFLTFLSNLSTNLNLTDMETCYKLFKTEIIQSVPLNEKRFGFEPEITAKIARIKHLRLYEVGISYHGRFYHEGKKIGWKDGFRAIYCIIKYGFLKMS
ncbi:glycosyltransferase family 2 protein [Pseudofulvibacter geojedonensis]|uniref:Glycosyltransferase family 2 protein n=1 Tax=Pseudofulvibacter geojedonensis TaxID=1123758 RepID=A0ABW3HZU3_9FLAO